MTLDGYYSRFDPTKGYERHLFRIGKVVQCAELNEVQETEIHRLKGVADALFRDGAIIRDAAVVVDPDTGAVTAEAGAVYLRGAVRGVPPAGFAIARTGIVQIGVYLDDVVITEADDPALRDPAIGPRNYNAPGAARLRADTAWGFAGDGQGGEFYPVYTVVNGVLVQKEPPPQVDSVSLAIADYDLQSAGGFYVSAGLRLTRLADDGANQVYSLSEGVARIAGREVRIPHAIRLAYPALPDLKTVSSEPHTAVGGTERVTLNHGPVDSIQQVLVTKQKTVTLTHGGFSGAQDALPDSPVTAIVAVNQGGTWGGSAFSGGTTYLNGTDYKLTSDKVDWSLPGAEVAPGSTYQVVYQYLATVAPTGADATGFTVSGAVAGSLIQTTYKWRLPRYDRLCLDKDGVPSWVTGVASDTGPVVPDVPSGMLGLASVYQSWDAGRRVVSDAIRVVPMNELEAMRDQIDTLYGLVALANLNITVNLTEPAAKKGVFVDAFRDNALRDQGIVQDAAIVNGELMLPIDAQILAPSGSARVTLSYTPEVVLEQAKQSGSMKINPYQAFDPVPAVIKLTPEVDFWTTTVTSWTTDGTTRFVREGHFVPGVSTVVRSSTSIEDTVVSSVTTTEEYLRPITVTFTIDGFDPNETLDKVTFDGIDVTPV
ncbi:hypothetical protein TSO221_18400 [Azospirillum sp. TSO22-1]|nr:hypothetical protein TSO221_18400 [Azospirillum sp. TSO22-1]